MTKSCILLLRSKFLIRTSAVPSVSQDIVGSTVAGERRSKAGQLFVRVAELAALQSHAVHDRKIHAA